MIRDRIVVGIHNQALSERTPDESQTHTGESQDTNEAMGDLTRAVEGNPASGSSAQPETPLLYFHASQRQ